jgi:hypothetical protein
MGFTTPELSDHLHIWQMKYRYMFENGNVIDNNFDNGAFA